MLRLVTRAAPVGAFAAVLQPTSPSLAESPLAPPVEGRRVHIGSRLCAFAGRTAWALHEFGAPAEWRLVDVELGSQRPAWLREVNPANTVPVILDDAGARVPGNSAQLSEWLIARAGAASPRAAREVARAFDREALGPLYALLRCRAPRGTPEYERACARVEAALDALEARCASAAAAAAADARGGGDRAGAGGPFLLGGDAPSLADVAVASVLWRFQASLRAFRGYELVDPARTPRVARALAACAARPSFVASQPSELEVVDFYSTDATYDPNCEYAPLDEWVARMCAGVQAAP